jgi:lipoate-protein ligase B
MTLKAACKSYRLGLVDYPDAWQLQKDLAAMRGRDVIGDSLLLLEHPHTYTLGSSGSLDHLLMDEDERRQRGVAVYHVDRGGDITYHGPGQLVGYPIIQLDTNPHRHKINVVDYIRQLEAMLINVLATFDIQGERLPGYTGVWVDVCGTLHKIAAIGVKVTGRRVTMHGFALNVNPDMHFFEGIIPCGIDDKPVTSMVQLLEGTIKLDAVMDAVEVAFGRQFERTMQVGNPHQIRSIGVR